MSIRWIGHDTKEHVGKRIFRFQAIVVLAMVLWIVSWSSIPTVAQTPLHTITFDNQSGQNAVVKLVGPTRMVTRISLGYLQSSGRSSADIGGEYYILVRYGNAPKEYVYTKGEPFVVNQLENQYSVITITLHRVISGHSVAGLISGEEFENAGVSDEGIGQAPTQQRFFPLLEGQSREP